MADLYNSNLGPMQRRTAGKSSAIESVSTRSAVKYALYDESSAAATAGDYTNSSFDEPNSLLMADMGNENDHRIAYDQIALVGAVSALPASLGKEIVLSRKNGNLRVGYCTQMQDISGSAPVGNHDLVKNGHLAVTTGMKQPFVAEFDTVFRHGDEHFYGNDEASNARNVAHVFMPSDFDERNSAAQEVIDRPVTNSMRVFLKRFPGQTVDTLSDYVTELKNSNNVMVRFSATGGGPTSAVTMWYDALVDDKNQRLHPRLQETSPGLAVMPKDVYSKCDALARAEIARYISLGDMTSENFAIRIKPFAVNGKDQLGICDFAFHHPGLDPASKVVDPATGNIITAQALFEKTPISLSLRFLGTYKKVNNGSML